MLTPFWCFLFFFFFNFLTFIYFWEREKEHEQGRGREREGHRIWSRLQALSCQHWEPASGLEPTNHRIVTWAEVRRLTNRATQAPHPFWCFFHTTRIWSCVESVWLPTVAGCGVGFFMRSWAFQLQIASPSGQKWWGGGLWESRNCILVSPIQGVWRKCGSQKRSEIPLAAQEGEMLLQGLQSSMDAAAEAEGPPDHTGH